MEERDEENGYIEEKENETEGEKETGGEKENGNGGEKENGGEKLRNLLTENGFKIISKEVGDPFCLFVCSKEY